MRGFRAVAAPPGARSETQVIDLAAHGAGINHALPNPPPEANDSTVLRQWLVSMGATAFLASDVLAVTTGASLTIDGGWTVV